jgi:hypothetical protein
LERNWNVFLHLPGTDHFHGLADRRTLARRHTLRVNVHRCRKTFVAHLSLRVFWVSTASIIQVAQDVPSERHEDLPSVGLSPSGLVGRLRSSYALFKFFTNAL